MIKPSPEPVRRDIAGRHADHLAPGHATWYNIACAKRPLPPAALPLLRKPHVARILPEEPLTFGRFTCFITERSRSISLSTF